MREIEASVFPHMKPEDARAVMARHRAAMKPPQESKPASMALLDGFREAGFAVVHE